MSATSDYGTPTDPMNSPPHGSWAEAVASSLDAKVGVAGGSMTGPLTLAADPTQPLQAVTKSYADRQIISARTTRQSYSVPTSWVPFGLGNLTEIARGPATTKLSVNGDAVVIGPGISSILTCANMPSMYNEQMGGDKLFTILKNGLTVWNNYWTFWAADARWMPEAVAPTVVTVATGDRISLAITFGGTGNIELMAATLTVEAVG